MGSCTSEFLGQNRAQKILNNPAQNQFQRTASCARDEAETIKLLDRQTG